MAKYGLFLKDKDGSIIDPTKLSADDISFAYIRSEDRYQHDDQSRSEFIAQLNLAGIPFGFWCAIDYWSGDISGLKQSIEFWADAGKKAPLQPCIALFPADVGTSSPPAPLPAVPKRMYELVAMLDDLTLKYGQRPIFCATPSMIAAVGDFAPYANVLRSPLMIFNWNTDTPVIAPWTRYLFQIFKGNVTAQSFMSGLGVIRFPYTDAEFNNWMLHGVMPTSDPVVSPPVDPGCPAGQHKDPITGLCVPDNTTPVPGTLEQNVQKISDNVQFIADLYRKLSK